MKIKLICLLLISFNVKSANNTPLKSSGSNESFEMLDLTTSESPQTKHSFASKQELDKLQIDLNKRLEELRAFFSNQKNNDAALSKQIKSLKDSNQQLVTDIQRFNNYVQGLKKDQDNKAKADDESSKSCPCCYCCLPFLSYFHSHNTKDDDQV